MTNRTMKRKHKQFIEEMNAIEVRNMINEKTIAILVLGACENHGDHMPFGSDFIFPIEIARRVATKVSNVIVLPAIPYGVSLHHDKFQMTMSLNPETMVDIVCNILSSLEQNKIRRVLIINGHDGNIGPIEISARTMKNKNPDMIIACLESWWVLVGQLKKELFEVWNGLGHGGEAETSAVLAVRPDLVNLNSAPKDVVPNLPENIRIFWKFDELTSTGATGSPQKATIRKGNEILQLLEDVLISFIREMESTDWKYGIYLK
ncbi:MAG TPA: creatininase family protein [Nitrososphaeraceae archaeon]|nr:creatininase family protein [Nitrososphaeraceae archaeon]